MSDDNENLILAELKAMNTRLDDIHRRIEDGFANVNRRIDDKAEAHEKSTAQHVRSINDKIAEQGKTLSEKIAERGKTLSDKITTDRVWYFGTLTLLVGIFLFILTQV